MDRHLEQTEQTELTTFYNHSCPVCRVEIEHYQRLTADGDRGLAWVDSSADKSVLAEHGISGDDILKRLYVVDRNGTLYGGVDAFILIWRRTPRYGWLATLARAPVVKPAADFLYDRILAPALFAWNKRTGRLGPAEPQQR